MDRGPIFTVGFDDDRLRDYLHETVRECLRIFANAGEKHIEIKDPAALAAAALELVAEEVDRDLNESSKRFVARFLSRSTIRALRKAYEIICRDIGEPYTRATDALFRGMLRDLLRDRLVREPDLAVSGSTVDSNPLTAEQTAALWPLVEALIDLYTSANRARVRGLAVEQIEARIEPFAQLIPDNHRGIVREVLLHFGGMNWEENGEAVGPSRMAHEHARRALGIAPCSARTMETHVSRSRLVTDRDGHARK